MAITCKICAVELDVFSGGRCRKCRQLVCKNCTATGGVANAKGLLCKSCAASESELNNETVGLLPGEYAKTTNVHTAPTSENLAAPAPVSRFQHWKMMALIAAAALVFIAIVAYPWVGEWYYLRALKRGDDREAVVAIEHLAKRGGSKRLLNKLFALIENAPDPARQRALRTLGKIPLTVSRDYLQNLLRQSRFETPQFRAQIIEALREQERDGLRDE